MIQDEITEALNKDANIRAAAIEFADKIANNKTLMENVLLLINKNPNLTTKRKALIQALYNPTGGRRRTKKTKYSKQIRSKRVNIKHITKNQN